MNYQRRLAIAAGSIFALSFFLPALRGASGFSCLGFCWAVLTRNGLNNSIALGGWLYYGGFVVTNAVLIVLFTTILLSRQFPRVRLYASIIVALHVFSWLIANLISLGQREQFDLRVGYFVWSMAFLLLFSAHVVAKETPNRPPEPTSPSVRPLAGAGGTPSVAADH
jgi:hypothetical protein